MATLSIQTNWQSQHNLEHWLKHSIMPVVFIALFLMVPKPWTFEQISLFNPLEVELIDASQPKVIPVTVEPVTVTPLETETKPEEEVPPPEPATKPIQSLAPPKPQTPPTTPNSATVNEPTTEPLTSGDVLRMLNNRTSLEITPEFEARIGPATDYFPNQPQVTDWYADIPYLDESVDKPELQMNFYAEGWEGSIERFFDRITISKTFTTKYGTKIHCALVGVLVSCIWK